MELKRKLRIFHFTPTLEQLQTVGPTAFPMLTAKKGTWVEAVVVHGGEAFHASASFTIGDDDNTSGYGTVTELDADHFYVCQGPYMQESSGGEPVSNIGVVYGTRAPWRNAQDAVNLYYTGHVEATTGRCTVYLVYSELLGGGEPAS